MDQFCLFARKSVSLFFLASASITLTACSSMEPLKQPYTWRPLHVYDANITAQVERKSDLVAGRPLGPSDGHEAAEAVQRWRDGKVRKIQNTDLAQIQSNSSNSSSGDSGGSGN